MQAPQPPRKRGAVAAAAAARQGTEQQRRTGQEDETSSAGPGAPCGACKFLRRRCVPGCVFAPHFSGGGTGRERGAAQFAAVHRVFGASNVAKLLSRVPVALRRDTARTVCYEAQARVADPVYGCVGTILALQHQVALLQGQLSVLQSQLFNCRLAYATTHPDGTEHLAAMQPAAYSVASAPGQMVNYDDLPQAVDFMDVEPQMRGLESLQLSQPPHREEDESHGMSPFSDNVAIKRHSSKHHISAQPTQLQPNRQTQTLGPKPSPLRHTIKANILGGRGDRRKESGNRRERGERPPRPRARISRSSPLPPRLSAARYRPPPARLRLSSPSSSPASRATPTPAPRQYHPRNLYFLLLDRAASDRAREASAVHVVGDPEFANPRGASVLAAALLLRLGQGWTGSCTSTPATTYSSLR
ncbi:unnamed protein product [Alopecurus aequalis]